MRPLLLVAFAIAFAIPACAADNGYDAELEMTLFRLANQEREKRGIGPLKWNTGLRDAARVHTEKMAEYEMLSHQFKDEERVSKRLAAAGLKFDASAENVGLATDSADLHSGWMQSSGHRKNLLNPRYNAIGIGVVKRGRYYYATQDFAHTLEDLGATQAEERLAGALAAWRKQRGFSPLPVAGAPELRRAACAMARSDNLSAKSVPTERGARGTVAFTAFNLDDLPGSLEKLAARPDVRRLNIGACFATSPSYPGGTYWFAVSY